MAARILNSRILEARSLEARSLDRRLPAGTVAVADVGTPQVGKLVRIRCLYAASSGKVALFRHLSAVFKKPVPGGNDPVGLQYGWSRGCRRADASFWFWQWQLLSQLAPRRKKSWLNRSRSNPNIPANTSDLAGRACRRQPDGPVPHLWPATDDDRGLGFFPETSAIARKIISVCRCLIWAGSTLSAIQHPCHFDKGTAGC